MNAAWIRSNIVARGVERYNANITLLVLCVEKEGGHWLGWVGNYVGNRTPYDTRKEAEAAAIRGARRLLRKAAAQVDALEVLNA